MDEDSALELADSPLVSQNSHEQSSLSHHSSKDSPAAPVNQEAPGSSPEEEGKSPAVQSVIVKSSNATYNSESPSSKEPRPRIKKQPKLPKFTQSVSPKVFLGVPLVSSASAGMDTYDLDVLQDPKTQRAFQAAHRFHAQPPYPLPRSLSPPSDKNFLLRNIASTREKSAVKTMLSVLNPSDLPRAFSQEPRNADFQHLLEFGTQAELRRKKRAEDSLKQEMSECSFRPTILPNAQRVRSAGEYYEYMLAYQQRVKAKTQGKRDEFDSSLAAEAAGLFHPTLCTHSRELAADTAEPRFQHLYKQHKARMLQRFGGSVEDSVAATDSSTASSADNLFKPKVNPVSEKKERTEPASRSLYQEALDRANRKQSQQSAEPRKEKLPVSGSNTILKERFLKEFREKWFQIEPEKPDISYTSFIHLLSDLHFIANNPKAEDYSEERMLAAKAWSLCAPPPEDRSSRSTVEEFLLSVMNLWTTEPKLTLTAEKAAEIRTVFGKLYSKRVGKLEKSQQQQSFRAYYGLTFHPTINPFSLQITRESGEIGDLMFAQAQKNKEKLDKLRSRVNGEELKECVFTPEVNQHSEKFIGVVTEYTNDPLSQDYVEIIKAGAKSRGHALYQLAGVAQERQKRGQRTGTDRETEANMVECTFLPDLSLTRENGSGIGKAEPVGLDKTVERLKKAREEAERVKGMLERGYVQVEAEPVRFTVEHKYKSIPVFDPSKAPAKKVGSADGPRVSRVIRGKVVLTPTPPPSVTSPLPTDATPNADSQVIPAVPVPIDSSSLAQNQAQPSGTTPSAEPQPAFSMPDTISPPSLQPAASELPQPLPAVPPPAPQKEPLLSVSVTVSETEKDDLILYKKDDINSVVQVFARKHGLPEDHAARLVELLEFQVAEIEQ